MSGVRHVTNGDSAVERMRAAGIDGDMLPWRDVLHDGPVPDAGRDVLDAVELNGMERWMSGVHLAGARCRGGGTRGSDGSRRRGTADNRRGGWDADDGDPNLIPHPAA